MRQSSAPLLESDTRLLTALTCKAILVFVCLCCMTFLSTRSNAQHASHLAAPPRQGQILPPGTIDGSKTPEVIPDVIAYRLVFAAFSEPADAAPAQLARQGAKLSQLKLSDSDAVAVTFALSDFHSRYSALIAIQSPQPTQVNSSAFIAARDAIVVDTLTTIASRASPDAR
jgi:hypothetical protein